MGPLELTESFLQLGYQKRVIFGGNTDTNLFLFKNS